MVEVLTDMRPRLTAAAADVADAHDAYRASLELRDELVVRAVDEGMSQRAVAAAAGIRVGRVSAILAGSQPQIDG